MGHYKENAKLFYTVYFSSRATAYFYSRPFPLTFMLIRENSMQVTGRSLTVSCLCSSYSVSIVLVTLSQHAFLVFPLSNLNDISINKHKDIYYKY